MKAQVPYSELHKTKYNNIFLKSQHPGSRDSRIRSSRSSWSSELKPPGATRDLILKDKQKSNKTVKQTKPCKS